MRESKKKKNNREECVKGFCFFFIRDLMNLSGREEKGRNNKV